MANSHRASSTAYAAGRWGVPRWLAPWAGYVLAVMIGAAFTGRLLEVGELVLGLPIAWLVSVIPADRVRLRLAIYLMLLAAGLAIGFWVSPNLPN